jgi:competence protein ComK
MQHVRGCKGGKEGMGVKGSYEIGEDTQALEPMYNERGQLCTIVHETNATYTIEKPPLQIVEHSCLYYGCGYEGLLEAAKLILGLKQMVPICVCYPLRLYIMPTCSPESDKCFWLALRHIHQIERYKQKKAKVILANGTSLIIDAHRDTLEARRAKTTLLYYTVETRSGIYKVIEQKFPLWRFF